MNADVISSHVPVTSQKVPVEERMEVLPRHFGRRMILVETAIYTFMRYLAENYRGGFWQFYELSNGGFYMAPEAEPLHIQVRTNGYAGQMSAEAAGITACLFALSHLSFECPDEALVNHFHWLREFAGNHAEAGPIFSAID